MTFPCWPPRFTVIGRALCPPKTESKETHMNGMKELWYTVIAAIVTFFGMTAFAGFVESVQ